MRYVIVSAGSARAGQIGVVIHRAGDGDTMVRFPDGAVIMYDEGEIRTPTRRVLQRHQRAIRQKGRK